MGGRYAVRKNSKLVAEIVLSGELIPVKCFLGAGPAPVAASTTAVLAEGDPRVATTLIVCVRLTVTPHNLTQSHQ